MKTLNIQFIVAILFIILTSCENLKDTYEEFIKNGETIYVAKADSITVRGGKNRVEISWLLLTDPNVNKYKIFYNNNRDSVEGFVEKTKDVDTVKVLINDMEENIYHFGIIMYDKYGNSSIKTSTIGKIYGERYQRSLLNRAYRDVYRINSRDIVIEWMPAGEDIVRVECEYMDRNNILRQHITPKSITKDTIKNFPIDGTLKFRTAFIPETTAIDTFFTNYELIEDPFFEVKFDKSLWKNAMLDGDAYNSEWSVEVWKLPSLWDEGDLFFYQATSYGIPNWFTIDLGTKYRITKMRVNQLTHGEGWMFNGGAPKKFEIWGSNTPSTNWSDWTLLGTFESVKPSGLPLGQLSNEDYAVNLAGENYNFNPTTNSFQYIRFKTLEIFNAADNHVCLKELTFWGQPVD